MRSSRSFLRFAAVLGVLATAGCDQSPSSVTAPLKAPSEPNALIVPTGYSDVSDGANFVCAVRTVDGGLVCWGENDYGKATPPTGKYRQVSAGLNHACALRSDYFVVCWGQKDFGAATPPAITFSQVSAGNKYSCGVRMDNRQISCWGSNSSAFRNTPTAAFTQVSTNDIHTCGVTFSDNNVLCWGDNSYGQGNVPSGHYTQVSNGGDYTCAVVLGSGTVACWGRNLYGQAVSKAGNFTQVSAAYTHTCAIRATDHSILCWGQDRVGMLNAPAGSYSKLGAGDSNACAIRSSDGALICWGNNASGMSTPPGLSTAHQPPIATMGGSASVIALDSIRIMLTGAQVPGYPEAKTFTYQFDCGDGNGYGAPITASSVRCPTRVAGTRTVRAKVIDADGDTASYSLQVPVTLRPDTVRITSAVPVNPVMGTSTYTVVANATSGRPVTIIAAPSGVCSASGNVITFKTIGTCGITADRPADSTYGSSRVTQTAKVIYPFEGFGLPVHATPAFNVMTAGRYVDIPFSVGGNRGTVVLSNGVTTMSAPCVTAQRINVPSSPAGVVGLKWDTATGRYVYTLKTDATWSGTCRNVTITLADGTMHSLKFFFN